ncbi:hypothetical protein FCL40_06565 [Ferrimonas sediminicola]|uniref:Phosphate-selective porin O and P n=1 Tax=Ferrimonas sediminicola TaxID=2569538 RepID=A0A4U1BFC6_9GAMM|nr:hypothetical protein [Ferrimonas sediminicola]TKB49817.1 hypothetical protein FCL40_06565 [Ferrimonas sediminicola]
MAWIHRTLIAVGLSAVLAPAALASEEEWGDEWGDDPWADAAPSPWQPVSGYLELGYGRRLQSDATGLDGPTLSQALGRIESGYRSDTLQGKLRLDLGYDDAVDQWVADVRELTLGADLGEHTHLKLGRQVLTWGTGDYLFLNDLFPKDWQAFFSGQEDEYLKAPVNGVKGSWYGEGINLDLVYMPRFEADNYLNGERFSFFDPVSGKKVAPDRTADEPSDDAAAVRLYWSRNGTEYALYGYWGFTGQPLGADAQGKPQHARLNAYGASVRLPALGGLLNAETAYHQSLDADSTSLVAPQDKVLALLGYETELVTNLTGALQYYLEHIRHYQAYLSDLPNPEYGADRNRQLLTLRLTYRAMQEKLILSLFSFYSPTDQDFYLKPQVSYRPDDHWLVSGGVNLMNGQDPHTFFGQLDDNSNAWLRLRYYY